MIGKHFVYYDSFAILWEYSSEYVSFDYPILHIPLTITNAYHLQDDGNA
jgi:hypothetical protein